MIKSKTLMILLAAFIAVSAACAKKQVAGAQAADPNKPAPALPSDVQSVSGAATASTSTSAGAPAATNGSMPAETSTSIENAAAVATANGDSIVATGEFVSPVRSELAVKTPGRVAKMYVDEGSRVTRGQPVLELETDYVRLNLQRAEADVARAKAAETDAQRDLDRKKDLIAKDSIPRSTYDRSESTFEQAQAMRASASAQAQLMRQQLSDAILRSPIDGVVAEKRTDVGQRLGDATVALVIVQTSPLKLRFKVPERYLASVHKGQVVKATVDPYPGQVFEGRVTTVGGVIDSSTRSLTVDTEFPNGDGKLRPGLFARVEMAAK